MTDCLIISGLAREYAEELARPGNPAISVTPCTTSTQALAEYSGQKILFGDPNLIAPVLPAMPAIEWVQSTWAGVLPLIQAARRDYLLTGVKNVFGEQMSEYVIGYILAHELRIAERQRSQGKREWNRTPSGTLNNKRIGIMGTGSIGRHVARVSANFGMQVSGLSRSGAAVAGFDTVVSIKQLHAFLHSLDYLVAALPQTPDTDTLLDDKAFAQLPGHAYFINVGRSNVVNDAALIAALQHEKLGGAVLDVFDQEPLPKDSPLWATPNLLVTAHVSALSHPSLLVPIFIENFRRYQQKLELNYVVDFDTGY
jgi:phosphoglycerate dehydrogenase-like enzyme